MARITLSPVGYARPVAKLAVPTLGIASASASARPGVLSVVSGTTFDPATLNATNTGPRIPLTTYGSDYFASANTVISGLYIQGKLICTGNNVQATDCQIDAGITTYYAGNYSMGHKFTYCGIGIDGGLGGTYPAIGDFAAIYGDYEMGWCNVRGFSDLVWLQGGTQTWLHHSWLHQNLLQSAADHNDICQMTSGTNSLVEYCRLSCDLTTQNSVFQLGADTGPISNVEIRYNLMDSSNGTVRNQHMIVWGSGSGGSATGLNVHDNVIDTSVWTGGMVSNGNGDPYTWHNNHDRNGNLIVSGGQS